MYQPNGSRGVPAGESPPLQPPPGVTLKHYEYGKLPQKYVKKYQYASRSVKTCSGEINALCVTTPILHTKCGSSICGWTVSLLIVGKSVFLQSVIHIELHSKK